MDAVTTKKDREKRVNDLLKEVSAHTKNNYNYYLTLGVAFSLI